MCQKSQLLASCDGHHIFQTISQVLYLRQQIRRLTCANISVLAWLHLSLRCPSFSLRHSTQTEPLPTPSERWRGLRTSPRLVHFCQSKILNRSGKSRLARRVTGAVAATAQRQCAYDASTNCPFWTLCWIDRNPGNWNSLSHRITRPSN